MSTLGGAGKGSSASEALGRDRPHPEALGRDRPRRTTSRPEISLHPLPFSDYKPVKVPSMLVPRKLLGLGKILESHVALALRARAT